jgi:hypothetical protein
MNISFAAPWSASLARGCVLRAWYLGESSRWKMIALLSMAIRLLSNGMAAVITPNNTVIKRLLNCYQVVISVIKNRVDIFEMSSQVMTVLGLAPGAKTRAPLTDCYQRLGDSWGIFRGKVRGGLVD